MRAVLVTLEAAKDHLRVTDNASDALILGYVEAASDLVLRYVRAPIDRWDVNAIGMDTQDAPEMPPRTLQVATLLIVGDLFAEREGGDPMSQAVKDLLHQYRDPALA
jgi:hypothetical protein